MCTVVSHEYIRIQLNNIFGSLQVLEDFSLFLVKLEALQKECRKELSSKKASKLVSIINSLL